MRERGSGPSKAGLRRMERVRKRLERAREMERVVSEQYGRREVRYGALLFARDELERAQREHQRLLKELGIREKRAKRAKPGTGKTVYREPKELICSDCLHYEFRLKPLGHLCRLPDGEVMEGGVCEDFVAAHPCPVCGHPTGEKRTRPPIYCSDRCRKLAWWRRHKGKVARA